MILSKYCQRRQDLALLCNYLGLGSVVEVGVDRGAFAREFMELFKGYMLWCVDPWEPCSEQPWDRQADFLTAIIALAPYAGRVRFLRMPSLEAVKIMRRHQEQRIDTYWADFAYIDGAHDGTNVKADLEAWWAVLPPHGILAGHDYDEANREVKVAVNKFALQQEREVYVTHETTFPPSWYMYKNPDAKE